MYTRIGLHTIGKQVVVGEQRYELMLGDVSAAESAFANAYRNILPRIERTVRWELDIPFRARDEHCAHGGRSFDAIGTSFDRLAQRNRIVTADVLDAWFAPAPGVVEALGTDVPWLCHSSPPARADGMVDAIATARDVDPESIVVGAGSSSLMYLAVGRLLARGSRVLLTRPTYGEYPHLMENVVGARTDYLRIGPENGWQLDLDELRRALRRGYELVVLVNPANPTGGFADPEALWQVLSTAPPSTKIWIDEAYVDYGGRGRSLERRVSSANNVIVCKSMSKVYALSGVRAAYLVASVPLARQLRRWSPPWSVSLPGQIAAVRALADSEHYARCWAATAEHRRGLADQLGRIPHLRVRESEANFVLVRLPEQGSAAEACRRCEAGGVFVRDLSTLSADFRGQHLRIAVKDATLNARIVTAVEAAVAGMGRSR